MSNPSKTKWQGKPDLLHDDLLALRALWEAGEVGDVQVAFRALLRPIAMDEARKWKTYLASAGRTVEDGAESGLDGAWTSWQRNPGPRPAATVQLAIQRGVPAEAARAVDMGRYKAECLWREGQNPVAVRRAYAGSEENRVAVDAYATTVVDLDWDPCERLERKEQRELDHAVLADMTRQAGISPDVLAAALADGLDRVAMQKFERAMRKAAQTDDPEAQRVECTEPPGRDVQGALWVDDDAAVAPPIVGGQPQADDDEDGQTLGV